MDEDSFLREARRLTADRSRFVVTDHARRRDPANGKFPIPDKAIVNCINGNGAWVSEGPAIDLKEACGWKGRISRREPGTLTEVACVVVPRTRILIITAYEVHTFTRAPKRFPGSPDTGDEDF
jgi:hypothetical protein